MFSVLADLQIPIQDKIKTLEKAGYKINRFKCKNCGGVIYLGDEEIANIRDINKFQNKIDELYYNLDNQFLDEDYEESNSKIEVDLKISGQKDSVRQTLLLLDILQVLGNIGASREIKLFVDGDGAFNISIDKDISKIHNYDFDIDDLEKHTLVLEG